jgi:hypothetical protein
MQMCSPQKRDRSTRGCPAEKIAENMITLGRRASLDVSQHRSHQRRVRRGVRSAKAGRGSYPPWAATALHSSNSAKTISRAPAVTMSPIGARMRLQTPAPVAMKTHFSYMSWRI